MFPEEYPETRTFTQAISDSYWDAGHFKFHLDLHDWHHRITTQEREVLKRTLLAISQVEVSVKRFWLKSGDMLPKPEFWAVAACFSDCERRHADTYSKLLQLLGLVDEFERLSEVPCIQGRIDYMAKATASVSGALASMEDAEVRNRTYVMTLAMFSLFVENVSLFSQFAIIKSFCRDRGVLRIVANAVQATQKEELIHAQYGIWLVNQIKQSHPDWFGPDFYEHLSASCHRALRAECGILDWIFEGSYQNPALQEFLKHQFNWSIEAIGGTAPFAVDQRVLASLDWFVEEIHAGVSTDFFSGSSPNYARTQIDASSLF